MLKYFGLGPYFFVEYMRRTVWLFFLLSLLECLRIYINAGSSGLSKYTPTFSTYLITTTLGIFCTNSRKLQWKRRPLGLWQLYHGHRSGSYIFGSPNFLPVLEGTLQRVNWRPRGRQLCRKTRKVLSWNWRLRCWKGRLKGNLKIVQRVWPCLRSQSRQTL